MSLSRTEPQGRARGRAVLRGTRVMKKAKGKPQADGQNKPQINTDETQMKEGGKA